MIVLAWIYVKTGFVFIVKELIIIVAYKTAEIGLREVLSTPKANRSESAGDAVLA